MPRGALGGALRFRQTSRLRMTWSDNPCGAHWLHCKPVRTRFQLAMKPLRAGARGTRTCASNKGALGGALRFRCKLSQWLHCGFQLAMKPLRARVSRLAAVRCDPVRCLLASGPRACFALRLQCRNVGPPCSIRAVSAACPIMNGSSQTSAKSMFSVAQFRVTGFVFGVRGSGFGLSLWHFRQCRVRASG